MSSSDRLANEILGNVGELRLPAQHTAPGAFVDSSGRGFDRLRAQQTSTNNPFFSQQFTGAGTMSSFNQPAQTGPANAFGQQAQNPFGSRPPQQPGSLIDI